MNFNTKYKILSILFVLSSYCNAQTFDYLNPPKAEDYFPSLKFQQTVGANILAGVALDEIESTNNSLDSTGYLHYTNDRRYGGVWILFGFPSIGCFHSPLKVKLLEDKCLWYPKSNIVLYTIHHNISVEHFCVDGTSSIAGRSHGSSKHYLVGYDSSSQEYIYISGFLYKHRIAKDFKNLRTDNPESDTLMNFIKLKAFDLQLSNLNYKKTENGFLIYEGAYIGRDKKYNPTIDWRIKVKLDDIDIVTYELLKVHDEDLFDILPIENTKKKKKK
ncbi:MAG: hypothetical protein KBB37_05720 [Bacteroidia bacterium]|nr:hypothetical protein [Bacteroidia bacterium]MBP7260766.1 hypothetical protein [Bacteroidia bacterium]MBP9180399.1 hypothetical protein [Bacteroidia bacterium]MBP9724414.1 hypothetical protein [Bacteroidia bacterium]